jgi:Protein of unknown function (DUF3040)
VGLPARQRRVLENIESELRGTDPRLATMFVIFGRLTRDEEMPRREELRHRAAILLLRIRLVLGSVVARLRPRRHQQRRHQDTRRRAQRHRELRRGSRTRPARPAYRYSGEPAAGYRAAGGRPAGARPAYAQARARRLRRRIRVAVFFPIALALMTVTIVLVARFGSPARCASVSSVATAKPHPRGKLITKGVRLCRPPALAPLPLGR